MSNSDYNKIISTINSVSRDYTYSPDPNNLICIDTSNNRIGINTLDPEVSLHISGGSIRIGGDISASGSIRIGGDISVNNIFANVISASRYATSGGQSSNISATNITATNNIDTSSIVVTNILDISRGRINANNIDISSTLTISRGRIIANFIDVSSVLDISRGRIIANNIDVSSVLDISRGRIIANNIDVSSVLDISRGRIIANFIDVSSVLDISRGRIIANFIDVSSVLDISRGRIIANFIDVSSTLDISRGRIIANNIDASAINTKTIDASNINIVDDFNMSTRPGSGGIITISGDYIIHTFLASGSFIPPKFVEYVEALIVGGGGGGGNGYSSGSYQPAYTGGGGGGGGGGGVVRLFYSPISQSTIPYTVTVGSGGSGSTLQIRGSNGGDSIFNGATARGGGLGAGWRNNDLNDLGDRGSDGGSGGGGYYGSAFPSLPTGSTIGIDNRGTYFGNNGAVAGLNSGMRYSGGGGGAQSSGYLYQGGDGIDDNILGVNYKWGGGGGGVNYDVNASAPSGGGGGGGGINLGGVGAQNGGFGGANTGGGGGGGRLSSTGGDGGSGIVVIRYRTTNSFNTINSTVFNGIFYYINYILPRLPSPTAGINIGAGSGVIPGLVIPIDMVNNDSVEINLKFYFTGSYTGSNENELVINYKNSGSSYLFDQNLAVFFIHNQNNTQYYNDGRIAKLINTDAITNVYTIKIHRVFNNRYLMSGTGLYDYYNIGTTNVIFSGKSNTIPHAIHLTWGPNYAMNARYTITNTPG